MRLTFHVDRVPQIRKPAFTGPLRNVLRTVVKRPIVTCTDPGTSLLIDTSVHPLAAAVHCAFSQHRALILSPDAIWLTIAQGFAQHVNANADALRKRLVRHEGVMTLTCPVPALETHQDWAAAIGELCESVTANVEPGVADLLRCDFSTTTPVTRVAGDVVLLDAFQRYFDYEFMVVCGIPSVTMLGTVDDWRKIESRVESLAKFDLDWWTTWLRPVCRELRRTAEGKPDLDFWQSIYMPEEIYGGRLVTGWIVRFFPYIEVQNEVASFTGSDPQTAESEGDSPDAPRRSVFRKNESLRKWSPPGPRNPWHQQPAEMPSESRRRWLCRGLTLSALPLGISRVPVRVKSPSGKRMCDVQLIAGFVGVSQTESFAVEPHIGWGIIDGLGEPIVLRR